MTKLISNPHTGEILKSEFLEPLDLSQNKLAKLISVPANRIHQIVTGHRGITAETDLKLCAFFGLSNGYFLHLQDAYELMKAQRHLALADSLRDIRNTIRPKFFFSTKSSIEKSARF